MSSSSRARESRPGPGTRSYGLVTAAIGRGREAVLWHACALAGAVCVRGIFAGRRAVVLSCLLLLVPSVCRCHDMSSSLVPSSHMLSLIMCYHSVDSCHRRAVVGCHHRAAPSCHHRCIYDV